MKHRLRFLLAALVTAMFLSGCAKDAELPHSSLYFSMEGGQSYFDAIVMDVSETGTYLVAPFAVEDGSRVRSSDRITFGQTSLESLSGVPAVKKGDAIRVVWGGFLMESYPMQIDGVTALYLLDPDGVPMA